MELIRKYIEQKSIQGTKTEEDGKWDLLILHSVLLVFPFYCFILIKSLIVFHLLFWLTNFIFLLLYLSGCYMVCIYVFMIYIYLITYTFKFYYTISHIVKSEKHKHVSHSVVSDSCNPMNCSTPGLTVHCQLPEFTQTHVHWVGDAIQPSHPLSSPSPSAFNLNQHQGLFIWASSSHLVAKVLEFQLQHQFFQWIFRTDFF